MPKIDTTLISGYGDMTPEQKLAALEGYEYEDHAQELEKAKSALSKSNSEAADWKKKYNAKLTEEEQKQQQESEELEKLKKNNVELLEKISVSENKAHLLGLGYDEALATDTAKAMFDGDMEKVFANQKKHQETMEKSIKAKLLEDTPKPPAGDGKVSKEAFEKMTLTEKAKLKLSDPDLFKSLNEIVNGGK